MSERGHCTGERRPILWPVGPKPNSARARAPEKQARARPRSARFHIFSARFRVCRARARPRRARAAPKMERGWGRSPTRCGPGDGWGRRGPAETTRRGSSCGQSRAPSARGVGH